MKKVSVVIPMYNVAGYLQRCVASVVDQQMNETIEILMIDDGSPDDSAEVAKEIASAYPFIKVVSQENKGLGGARNTGVDHATGSYILFLDADDWLVPNTLSKLIEIALHNELDILEFAANMVSEEKEIIGTIRNSSHDEVFTGVAYYNKIKYAGSACNKLYRRQFLVDHQLQFLEKIYGEDFEFNTRSFYHAQKVLAIDTIGAEFLQSMNSITRNTDRAKKDKYANDYIKILDSIQSFKEQYHNQDEQTIRFFDERLTMVNINAFYLLFKNNYSYKELVNYKKGLQEKGLLYFSYSVATKKKELFRKVMLQNFFLFRFSQPVKKMLGITG